MHIDSNPQRQFVHLYKITPVYYISERSRVYDGHAVLLHRKQPEPVSLHDQKNGLTLPRGSSISVSVLTWVLLHGLGRCRDAGCTSAWIMILWSLLWSQLIKTKDRVLGREALPGRRSSIIQEEWLTYVLFYIEKYCIQWFRVTNDIYIHLTILEGVCEWFSKEQQY